MQFEFSQNGLKFKYAQKRQVSPESEFYRKEVLQKSNSAENPENPENPKKCRKSKKMQKRTVLLHSPTNLVGKAHPRPSRA
jgi:hypothetical protein